MCPSVTGPFPQDTPPHQSPVLSFRLLTLAQLLLVLTDMAGTNKLANTKKPRESNLHILGRMKSLCYHSWLQGVGLGLLLRTFRLMSLESI